MPKPGSKLTKRPDWAYFSFWSGLLLLLLVISSALVYYSTRTSPLREGVNVVEPRKVESEQARKAKAKLQEEIPPDFNIKGGKFTLSNPQGDVTLTIYSDELTNYKGKAKLGELGATFTTPQGRMVALIARDLTFEFKEKVMDIKGSIEGVFPQSDQHFVAKSLHWELPTKQIELTQVSMEHPVFKVQGSSIVYDLNDNSITVSNNIKAEFSTAN